MVRLRFVRWCCVSFLLACGESSNHGGSAHGGAPGTGGSSGSSGTAGASGSAATGGTGGESGAGGNYFQPGSRLKPRVLALEGGLDILEVSAGTRVPCRSRDFVIHAAVLFRRHDVQT